MRKKAEYKSAARSRKRLQEAYAALITEQPIEKITVTAIAARAGVNRSTFYAHYSDPASLRGQMENQFIGELMALLKKAPYEEILRDPMPIFLALARFLEQNHDLFGHLILSAESGPFVQKVRELFIQRLLAGSERILPADRRESLNIQIRFFAGGIISICQDWFGGKRDKTLLEMFRLVCPSIVGGMAAYLPENAARGEL